ncbi:DNA mismatch repair protein MutS [Hydrogenibacillus schlegelii]|uniref:DNA mismatch repair protein MutS n=1 Tax=Hydrogenibacillus schlegelii TaxID=1484 RepID=UPI00235535E4|nr:DNA mismatch repair protein MutS [Hydrogenibacillus schlegelii]
MASVTAMADGLTPMFQQYLELRRQVPDALLFFRLGDFYELFFDDAHVVHKVLGLTLTGRDGGRERVPMCGVPVHAAEGYIRTLLEHGYKVAICEQVEDPKTARGLVRREIVRIITPGTAVEEGLVDDGPGHLAAVYGREGAYGVAFVDATTGEGAVLAERLPTLQAVAEELIAFRTREVLVPAAAPEGMQAFFARLGVPVTPFDPSGAPEAREESDPAAFCPPEAPPPARTAAEALYAYVRRVYPALVRALRPLQAYRRDRTLVLDPYTRANLELFRRKRSGEAAGSLFQVIDWTETPMGRRRLARRLERPLVDGAAIAERLKAVAFFVREGLLRHRVREALQAMYDLERLTARLALGTPSGGDLARLRETLRAALRLRAVLSSAEGAPMVVRAFLAAEAAPIEAALELLERALPDEPPAAPGEGRFFRPGYDAELDRLRAVREEGSAWLRRYEAEERERTGIRSLKVGYNKVFGYYIEVTKANLDRVPPEYVRKQTIAGGERYVTEALRAWEEAEREGVERLEARERALYAELIGRLQASGEAFRALADGLAELDVAAALAELAVRRRYVEPVIRDDGRIVLRGSRHPVVEAVLPDGRFVKNDVVLDDRRRILLITGPNMAGKSTLMRQVALAQILFQIGSFVPADAAELTPVDRIFTRIGAADDLVQGESTFLVEMKEVRLAVTEATPRSLILIDELGRGTSTEDGIAIAHAVIEYIHDVVGAKALVSTHFHELAALEGRLSGLVNVHMGVEVEAERIIFTYRLRPGATSRSYGIAVAARAGLPERIIRRAEALVRRYGGRTPEEQPTLFDGGGSTAVETAKRMIPVETTDRTAPAEPVDRTPAAAGAKPEGESPAVAAALRVAEAIRRLPLERMTPLEAFDRLREWQAELGAAVKAPDADAAAESGGPKRSTGLEKTPKNARPADGR